MSMVTNILVSGKKINTIFLIIKMNDMVMELSFILMVINILVTGKKV